MYMGRLDPKKGIDILLAAFRTVVDAYPDTALAIVGTADLADVQSSLLALVQKLDLSSRVVFTGFLAGENKLAALADADIWVLPSRTENFAVGMFEAMAAGLPIVISPSVDLHAKVVAADAGLAPHLDPQALANALVQLLEDKERRQEMGRRGRRLAETFDWRTVAHAMEANYQSLLQRSGR
jgi:glycosyltransferase involved in cell wall biosynthesis